jgi:hypothetical protein
MTMTTTITTRAAGFVSGVGAETELDNEGGTISVTTGNVNWTMSSNPKDETSTEMEYDNDINDLQITAHIVYDTSSEDVATKSNSQITSDVSTAESTDGAEPDSTSATIESVGTKLTWSSFAAESVPDAFTEPIIPIFDPESVMMVDGESMIPVLDITESTIPDTTTDRSISDTTTDQSISDTTTDQSISDTTTDQSIPDTTTSRSIIVSETIATDQPSGDSAPTVRKRVKRTPEDVIFTGKHCYQIVCSPRPTAVSNVTEVPKSYQGFSETPSKY